MSEKLDRRVRDFSKFDSMTTEQLQQILRLDAMKLESEESDTEELFYIMEVLADRRRNDSNFTGKTAQQAFENFQKYYMPEAAAKSANAVSERKNKPSVRWLHRLGTFAAALVIVFLTTITAEAFGFDLFGKVAKWSAEFFHFEESPEVTIAPETSISSDIEFSSLQQALEKYGVSQKLAPTWLPGGYNIAEIKVTDTPRENVFFSKFINEKLNDALSITIRQVLVGVPFNVEKTDDLVEIYTINGVAYYIFSNYDRVRAVWVVDEFECLITGKISIEDLKLIIDSI